MNPRYDYDDTDSPPYSPSPSEMERPNVLPDTLLDLREACAVLVTMTNPPDPDDEPDHSEYLRKLEAERKIRHAQKRTAEAKSMKADLRQVKLEEAKPRLIEATSKKEPPRRYSTRRPRKDSEDPSTKPQQTHYVPKDPNGRHESTEIHPQPAQVTYNITGEPVLPPVHAPIVERIREQQQKLRRQQEAADARRKQELARRKAAEDQALGHIRSSMHLRPKTSAAACVDYEGDPVNFSSNSTSRSNSDYAAVRGRPTSTGLTSLQAQSPNMADLKDRRPSEQPSSSNSMNEVQEVARLRADEYCAQRASRPASRQSKLSRMTSRSDLSSIRPSSRAGSFASSIADNINSYFARHRHNNTAAGSVRSGRSSSLGFRSSSRSSSMSRRSSFSNSGWWRNGGLRRRGSWASFRSGGAEARERNRLRKDGGPNLNRPLPALPGLDQYKEKTTHIGQMVKKKKVKKSKIGEPQPFMPADVPYVATLPPYLRSDSNLGQYEIRHVNDPCNDGASSAPLPNTDGTEEEFRFPRFDPLPSTERRSTAPEPRPQPTPASTAQNNPAKSEKADKGKDKLGKMKRGSSLNPIKPRRTSVTVDTSENPNHKAKLPPPMIRGPSYSKELASGVYPRRMEVNDGGQIHVPPVPAIAKASGPGRVKSPDRTHTNADDTGTTATTPPFGPNDPWRLDPILTPQPLSVEKKGSSNAYVGDSDDFTALPQLKSPEKKEKEKEKEKKGRKKSKGKNLSFGVFGMGMGGGGRERQGRVVCAN